MSVKPITLNSAYSFVNAYIAYLENDKSFTKSDIAKREILDLYRDDINKASNRYNIKISRVFENIPGFLSKHDKKIVLSNIDNNKVFSEYADPLFWLDDSMICNLCYRCNDPNIGFALTKDDSSVKCYMGDTGLLVSLAFSENELITQEVYKSILNNRLSINQGMIYENMISQMLKSMNNELYFYSHYSKTIHKRVGKRGTQPFERMVSDRKDYMLNELAVECRRVSGYE